MAAHVMTPRRKAALKKAQAASARKRKTSMKTRIKRKGRKIANKARKNSQPAARKVIKAAGYAGGYMTMRNMLGPGLANRIYVGGILAKAANGGYNKKKPKKKKR